MMLRKIICFILIILMTSLTPLSSFIAVQEVYASSTADIFESELLKQLMIPTLITCGLVFNTKESAEDIYQKLNDWMVANQMTIQFPDPNDPHGPNINLRDALLVMAGGKLMWNEAKRTFNDVITVGNYIWNAIKSWVDENFNVGENVVYGDFIDINDLPLVSNLSNEGVEVFKDSDNFYIYGENMELFERYILQNPL